MPEIVVSIEPALHVRLVQWSQEQHRPLPELARDILAAAERVRANYDPTIDRTTRGIRWDRDSGCGLCEAFEPLFAEDKAAAPPY